MIGRTPVHGALICVAVGFALSGCGGIAQARQSKPAKGGSPRDAITSAIDVHNAAVKDMTLFAKQALRGQNDCAQQLNLPPSQRNWYGVDAEGKALELIADLDLKPTNQRIPGWISTISSVPVSGSRRKLKELAIAELDVAHSEHEKEIFEFHAVGAGLQSHDCASAQKYLKQAAKDGDYVGRGGGDGKPVGAWGNEYFGLNDAKKLLHLRAALSHRLNPYLEAGVDVGD
jgi:hypothetical protein